MSCLATSLPPSALWAVRRKLRRYETSFHRSRAGNGRIASQQSDTSRRVSALKVSTNKLPQPAKLTAALRYVDARPVLSFCVVLAHW